MTKTAKKKRVQTTFSFKDYILRSIEKLYAESILEEKKLNKSEILDEILEAGFQAKGINPEEYGRTT